MNIGDRIMIMKIGEYNVLTKDQILTRYHFLFSIGSILSIAAKVNYLFFLSSLFEQCNTNLFNGDVRDNEDRRI